MLKFKWNRIEIGLMNRKYLVNYYILPHFNILIYCKTTLPIFNLNYIKVTPEHSRYKKIYRCFLIQSNYRKIKKLLKIGA